MKSNLIKDDILKECKRSIKEIIKNSCEEDVADAIKRFTNQYTLIREDRKKVFVNYYELEKLHDRIHVLLTETDNQLLGDSIQAYYDTLDLFEVPLIKRAQELIASSDTKSTSNGKRLHSVLSFKYTSKQELASIRSFIEYLNIEDPELVVRLIDDAEKEYTILSEFRERVEARKEDTGTGLRDFKLLCNQIRQGTKVIDVSKRKERIERFKDYRNFEEFIRYYFDGIQEDCHMAPLAGFHKDAIDKLLSGQKTYQIWEWFRGCGKSMIGTLYIPMWLAVNRLMKGMIIMSQNGERAQNLIAEFYSHIASNARIHADYGKPSIAGTPGTASLIVSFNDGYTFGVWALGIEQSPAGLKTGGNRPNYIVVDDADNKVSAGNSRIVKRRMKHIQGALTACTGVPSRIPNMFIYSNNRVHPNGLTACMVKEYVDKQMGNEEVQSFFYYSKVAITIDEVTKEPLLLEEGGVSAWPEYMSVEYIRRLIASMGRTEASMELYHKYIPQDDAFSSEWIVFSKEPPVDQIEEILVYCDPAYSDRGTACHSAVVVLGLIIDEERTNALDQTYYYYYIYDLWADHTTNCADTHMEKYKYFKNRFPDTSVRALVEASVSQGIHLERLYEDTHGRRPDLALYMPEFDTRAKGNKIERISMLIQPFKQGNIHCNENLEYTESYAIFAEQLNNFPESALDIPDALEGALFQFNYTGAKIQKDDSNYLEYKQQSWI